MKALWLLVAGTGLDPEAAPGSAATHLCLGPGWSTMSNTPFRRHKTWMHEGGTGTPLIVHWPKGIKSKGELRKTHGHITDIVPTILDLVGVSSGDEQQVPFPGASLQTIFEEDTNWEHPVWYYHEGNRGVRVGNWKLVAANDDPWELFNLDNDRTESKNLAVKNPDKVLELEKQWTKMLYEFRKDSPNKTPEKE